MQLSLAITWPQVLLVEEDNHAEAAQVNGGVREWQEFRFKRGNTLETPIDITSEEIRSMNFTFRDRRSWLSTDPTE